MKRLKILLAMPCTALFLVACAHVQKGSNMDSIGYAIITPDKVLTLHLIARGDHGEVGDAVVQYRPGEPHYQEVLDHIGPIQVGEQKNVAPWPEK